ncbi:putative peptide zinc metalloprotease protein [Flavobacterium sp. CF108]|uniref:hypothetical protein n=1 Tax=unclassified Flavobacterium TaxID=196869 RepID=UPI0008BCC187|nr:MULTISPECIES: hypothetical protein [unclassified Flavobacterium]SEO95156.1 putative peptide zinc metalloprotease protein [Flavobacterium sp. fv08]SHH82237.1 putative peptide zinc metalloprotease protein [Flavobacterium sp. CF108]
MIHNNKIHEIQLLKNNESYLILYQENYFSISRLFYELLQELKNNNHQKEKFIETYKISSADYDELSGIASSKLDFIVNKKKSNKSYIKLSVNILSEKKVINISQYLSFFFQKHIFNVLFIIVVLAAIITQFILNFKYRNHSLFDMSWPDYIFVYFALLAVMIFHELGHSAASKYFKVEPKEIGFGFYIIFPVLYSNVTRIWRLNKNEKVIVNLGGIYFQGLINCCFLLFLVYNKNFNLFTYLMLIIIKTNLFVMVYSLIPFIRNDGYWIVSDYFNIIGLNKKSYTYIFDLIKRKAKLQYFLLAFSIGQYVFVFFLCRYFLLTIPTTISRFILYTLNNGFWNLISTNIELLFKGLFSILILIIGLISFYKFLKLLFVKGQ